MQKTISFIIFLSFILTLTHAKELFLASLQAMSIYFEQLVPSMFISMILLFLLNDYRFFMLIPYRILTKLFNMNQAGIAYTISLILMGYPVSASLIDESYIKKEINQAGALRLFYVISISKTSFVINTCGMVLFKSITIGIYLYLIQLLSIIILLLITRKTPVIYQSKKAYPKLSQALKNAFIKTISSLYFIGGYLMLIYSLFEIIKSYLPLPIYNLLSIYLELTTGIYNISSLILPTITKCLLMSSLLSFASISIHMQSFAMLNSLKPKYLTFLAYRIIHILLALFFSFITISILG